MSQFMGWDSSQMLVCNYTIIALMECGNNFDNDTHPVIKYDKLFPWNGCCHHLPAFLVSYELKYV